MLRKPTSFLSLEYVLWVWVLGLIGAEFNQYLAEKKRYIGHWSNRMDIILLVSDTFLFFSFIPKFDIFKVLNLVYMILIWVSIIHQEVFVWAINVLIIACIFSWARLLHCFSISDLLV